MKKVVTSLTFLALTPVASTLASNLQPANNNIDDHIVITATQSHQVASRAPASMSVITAEQLKQRQVMNLSDAVRGLAGIQLSAVGFGRKGIEIRGMDADQTLILIDGQRLGGSADLVAHSNYDLSAISVNDIERIEVVRGPMSALYGSDALGGVINIITKQPGKQWRSQVSALGNWGDNPINSQDYQLQASTAGALIEDKLALRLSGSKQYQEDVPNRENTRISDIEGLRTEQARAALRWHVTDGQEINVMLSGSNEERWRDTSSGPNFYTYIDDIQRRHFSVEHTGDWQWGETTSRIYRTEVDRENRRTNEVSASRPSTITEDIVESTLANTLGAHAIHVGGQWKRQQLEDEVINDRGEAQVIQTAVFAQDDIAIGSNTSVLIGSRFDHHENFGWETSPRVYAVYNWDNWVFKGGYGEGFKAPNIKQLSPDYEVLAGGGRFTIVGNPDLNPERNRSYEFSAQYQQDTWRVGATVYHTKVDDLIETFCVANCGGRGALRHYHNVEQATLEGVELTSQWQLADDWDLAVNASYLDARNDSTDEWLLNKPRSSGYAQLDWHALSSLTAQLRVEYVGEQKLASGHLPSYNLVDLTANYQLNDQWHLSAGINNLTDVYLPEESESFEFVEPSRTAFIRVGLSF